MRPIKDIISIRDFERADIENILERAEFMEDSLNKKAGLNLLKNKILANLFFEPSTRTRMSFESAMFRLGGKCISFSRDDSSMKKGENLEDTLKNIDGYCDVVVIRHPNAGAARFAARVCNSPVINAGDGSNQHPTQTLLDLFTMKKMKGALDGVNIGIVGDLKFGRTVHSLVYALSMFGANITLVSPVELKMPRHIIKEIEEKFATDVKEIRKLTKNLNFDIIYVTRIQKERFPDILEYERIRKSYRVEPEVLGKDTIVMHPLPRVDEIDRKIDGTAHAVYFKQAHLGIPVRMAVLDILMGN